MTKLISTYLGEQIRERTELRFFERLRADLSRLKVPTTIYANFIADPRRNPRQIDFLVLTQHRLVHVELKTVRADSRINAGANGPWHYALPGEQMQQRRNAYRQALDATYAISDHVRRLTAQGLLPDPGRFFECIDTVVCLFPDVPAGSEIERHKHVTVCGYDALLDRLNRPGPRPPGWTACEADTLARELGLYAEPADPDANARRIADLNVLAEYRSRFISTQEGGLHNLIDIAAVDDHGDLCPAPLRTMIEVIRRSDALAYIGPSGSGKSHTARHAAIQTAKNDTVPIWLSCGDYEGDTFAVAMAKAAGRFTTEPWSALFQRATRQGQVPLIILDGLNECSPNQQRILLEGASSYRLTRGCALIMTAQQPSPSADISNLTAQLPSDLERAELLLSYGAPSLPNAEVFRTPWELAMAAECAADLPADATPADVFDLYIRRRTASERQRAQLRAVAISMQQGVQLSLRIAQAHEVIARFADRAPTIDELDQLLNSRLLAVGPQRLTFTHETLGRYLAAEHVVLGAATGHDLARSLSSPTLAGLAEIAITLMSEADRRTQTLVELADPTLIAKAARGEYGSATKNLIHHEMRQALERAEAITKQSQFCYTDDPDHPTTALSGHWRLPHQLTHIDRALLTACGLCMWDKTLITEIVRLLDATDHHSSLAVRALGEQGVTAPISAVVAVTFTPTLNRVSIDSAAEQPDSEDSHHHSVGDLPATVVLRACDQDQVRRWGTDGDSRSRAAEIRYAAPGKPGWGRLCAALLLINPASHDDLTFTPELCAEAWNLGGYHLRLAILEAAHSAALWMDDSQKDQLRAVLEDLDVSGNWALSSLLVEALARCGGVQPQATSDSIRDEIATTLARRGDPDANSMACSILSNQFEDEGIFGPYSQVIAELDDSDLVNLCGMALQSADVEVSIIRDWAVAQIARHMPSADQDHRRIIEEIAAVPPIPTIGLSEGVIAHLDALYGWSQVSGELPTPRPTSGDVAARTWRLLDELIFPLLSGTERSPDHSTAMWRELSGLCKPHAADALLHLHLAARAWYRSDTASTMYPRLLKTYSEPIRRIYEWALDHWTEVRPAVGGHVFTKREDAAQDLGYVGNAETEVLLRRYLTDASIAPIAIESIRKIQIRRG